MKEPELLAHAKVERDDGGQRPGTMRPRFSPPTRPALTRALGGGVCLALLPLLLLGAFYFRPLLVNKQASLPAEGDALFGTYHVSRMGELGGRWWKLGEDELLGKPYPSIMARQPQVYVGVDLFLLSSVTARFLHPLVNYYVLTSLILVINGWIAAWLVLRLTRSYGWAALGCALIILSYQNGWRFPAHHPELTTGWSLPAIWAFLRYLDAPSWWRGPLLGVAAAFVVQASFYFGFFLVLTLGVWWLGCLAAGVLTRAHISATIVAGLTAALLAFALTFPVWTTARSNALAAEFFQREKAEAWLYSSELWEYVFPPGSKYAERLNRPFYPQMGDTTYEGHVYPGVVILCGLFVYGLGRLRGWELCQVDPRFLDRAIGLSAVLVLWALWGGPAVILIYLVPFFRCFGRAGLLAYALWSVAVPVILCGFAQKIRWAPLRPALWLLAFAAVLYEGESAIKDFRNRQNGVHIPEPAWVSWLAREPSTTRLAVFPLEYFPEGHPLGRDDYFYPYVRLLHKHATLNGYEPQLFLPDLEGHGARADSMSLEGLRFILSLGYNALGFRRDYLESEPWIESLRGLTQEPISEDWTICRLDGTPDLISSVYRPGTRLDATSALPRAYLTGFTIAPDEEGRMWTGRAADFCFRLDRLEPLRLRMMATTFGPQRLVVILNSQEVTTLSVPAGEEPRLLEVDLPRHALASHNTLHFVLPDAKSPAEVIEGSEDTRILGMGITWMQLDSLSGPLRGGTD